MIRIGAAATMVAFAGAMALPPGDAKAETIAPTIRLAQADAPPPYPVRRPQGRLHVTPRQDTSPDDVYPRYNPGPNAVRECTATYVQEFRPSGTVIVPRMYCHWRPG